MTAVVLMSISGATLADERDYLNDSFQDHQHFTANQPAVGSAEIDHLNLSFQLDQIQSYGKTGNQTEIDTAEIDYLNDSFQDSY